MSLLSSTSYLLRRYVLRQRHLDARIDDVDATFRVLATDVAGRHMFKRGRYEAAWTDWLQRWLPERLNAEPGASQVLLDIGANLGFYSVLLRRLAPASVPIFAFEPEPDNAALLRHNIARNCDSGVTIHGFALSDRAGTATLHRYAAKNTGKHSMIPFERGGDGSVEVEVRTLDSWWLEQGFGDARVPLLKIDVEGHEPAVFAGAAEVLQRTDAVLTEHSPHFLARAGQPADAALRLLEDAGLSAHELVDGALQPVRIEELDQRPRNANLLMLRDSPT